MGLAPLLKEAIWSEDQAEMISRFLEVTGYGRDDLLSLSFFTKEFLTRNGGRYRLMDDGAIKHLSGPSVDVEDRLFV